MPPKASKAKPPRSSIVLPIAALSTALGAAFLLRSFFWKPVSQVAALPGLPAPAPALPALPAIAPEDVAIAHAIDPEDLEAPAIAPAIAIKAEPASPGSQWKAREAEYLKTMAARQRADPWQKHYAQALEGVTQMIKSSLQGGLKQSTAQLLALSIRSPIGVLPHKSMADLIPPYTLVWAEAKKGNDPVKQQLLGPNGLSMYFTGNFVQLKHLLEARARHDKSYYERIWVIDKAADVVAETWFHAYLLDHFMPLWPWFRKRLPIGSEVVNPEFPPLVDEIDVNEYAMHVAINYQLALKALEEKRRDNTWRNRTLKVQQQYFDWTTKIRQVAAGDSSHV